MRISLCTQKAEALNFCTLKQYSFRGRRAPCAFSCFQPSTALGDARRGVSNSQELKVPSFVRERLHRVSWDIKVNKISTCVHLCAKYWAPVTQTSGMYVRRHLGIQLPFHHQMWMRGGAHLEASRGGYRAQCKGYQGPRILSGRAASLTLAKPLITRGGLSSPTEIAWDWKCQVQIGRFY